MKEIEVRSDALIEGLSFLAWEVELIVAKKWADVDEYWDKRNKKSLPPGWEFNKWLEAPDYPRQSVLDHLYKDVVIRVLAKRSKDGQWMAKIRGGGFDTLSRAFERCEWSGGLTFGTESIAWRATHVYLSLVDSPEYPKLITPGLVPIRVELLVEE